MFFNTTHTEIAAEYEAMRAVTLITQEIEPQGTASDARIIAWQDCTDNLWYGCYEVVVDRLSFASDDFGPYRSEALALADIAALYREDDED